MNAGGRVGLALAGLLLSLGVVAGAGSAFGVGPLSATTPPSEVTDPGEMLARSLQATIDAGAVHLAGTVSGVIPGSLVDRADAVVTLDGTGIEADIRPRDGKTRVRVTDARLGISVETVTVWDAAWYRSDADAPWSRASLGAASADAGMDINPLTLVDRLRAYLETPGLAPTVRDVPCASASGRCHEVTLDAGSDPVTFLALLLPPDRAGLLPHVDSVITLDTDVETLRPAHLVVDGASADRTVVIHLVLDASRWDEDLLIEEPSAGPG
jgi:hypothetical protein